MLSRERQKSPVAIWHILLIAVYLASFLCTLAHGDTDTETAEVHDSIRLFETALYEGDIKSAAIFCVKDKIPPHILEALADEHRSRDRFCKEFKSDIGSDLTGTFLRQNLTKDMENMPVHFGTDVAYSEWGGYSLRKIGGEWQIDLAQYDYDRAVTEKLPYLQATPKMYDDAGANLKSNHESRWWVAEANFEDDKSKVEREFDSVLTKSSDVYWKRRKSDIQGRWKVTVKPYLSKIIPNHHKWPEFRAILEVTNDKLKIDSAISDLEKTASHGMLDGIGISFSSAGPNSQDWDIEYIHILGELHGVLIIPSDKQGDPGDAYDIVGTATK